MDCQIFASQRPGFEPLIRVRRIDLLRAARRCYPRVYICLMPRFSVQYRAQIFRLVDYRYRAVGNVVDSLLYNLKSSDTENCEIR